jgi:hypothetical protein
VLITGVGLLCGVAWQTALVAGFRPGMASTIIAHHQQTIWGTRNRCRRSAADRLFNSGTSRHSILAL